MRYLLPLLLLLAACDVTDSSDLDPFDFTSPTSPTTSSVDPYECVFYEDTRFEWRDTPGTEFGSYNYGIDFSESEEPRCAGVSVRHRTVFRHTESGQSERVESVAAVGNSYVEFSGGFKAFGWGEHTLDTYWAACFGNPWDGSNCAIEGWPD